MKPEIERTVLIILRNTSSVSLKEKAHISNQAGAVAQSDMQHVLFRVVVSNAIFLTAKVYRVNSVATPQIYINPKVRPSSIANAPHPRNDDIFDFKFGRGRQLTSIILNPFVVPDVAALTRRLYALKLGTHFRIRPSITEIVETVGGAREDARLNQPHANHRSGPTFASLAVHHNDVFGICAQPTVHVICELNHLLRGRHVVIVNFDTLHPIVKVRRVVRLLTAQVVHLIMILVLGVQEFRHALDGVPVRSP
mmetsp:Transcript_19367/g.23976  ORF Transcript_19367/g.23976 Transcript_19367/m.23976 type:complete len:252 (-) Transcript_19367:911-1666(-)